MKRTGRVHAFLAALTMVLVILAGTGIALAGPQQKETDAVLDAAESLFKNMKARDYKGIWQYLSFKSKANIVDATYRVMAKSGKAESMTSKEVIEGDFRAGGPIAKAYWEGYLESFNPDLVLEQSKWEIGNVSGESAEVLISYRKAEQPARLRMYKEGRLWKVGLIETFGSGKL